MKLKLTHCLYPLLFLLLSVPVFAQDHHDALEHFMNGKSLNDFQNEVGLFNPEIIPEELLAESEKAYQAFFFELKKEAAINGFPNETKLNKEYDQLIQKTKKHLAALLVKNKYSKTSKPVPPKALNGPCTNMDFETGNLTGWTLIRGQNLGGAPYDFSSSYTVTSSVHHQVVGNGTDPVTGIPTNNPQGGSYSVRLGDGQGVGKQAARMNQYFLVDSTNFLFTYSYAVIFESPLNHDPEELPYFTVRVFDAAGNSIPCGEYSVIANSSTASNYTSITYNGDEILYKSWESVFTNLSAYIGQNVLVEFTSADCSLSGHYGYCYLDAFCGSAELIASNNPLCPGATTTIAAPPGAGSYQWSTGATTQVISVSNTGTYSCQVTPFQGSGCNVTLSLDIVSAVEPTANFSSNAISTCVYDSVHFFDQSTIPAPGVIGYHRWDFDDGIITPLDSGVINGVINTFGSYDSSSHVFTSSGTYNVEMVVSSLDGCLDSITIPITVLPQPNLTTSPDLNECFGDSISLFGYGASTYEWDQGVSNGVAFAPASGSHIFTVIGTDNNGCKDTATVNVFVQTPPTIEAGPDQYHCEGDSAIVNGSLSTNYSWNNGVNDGVYFIPPPGVTDYIVTTQINSCFGTDTLTMTVYQLTTVNAGLGTIICAFDIAQLEGSMSNALTPVWYNNEGTFSQPDSLQTNYLPSAQEIYQGYSWVYFTSTNPYNCPTEIDSAYIQLQSVSSSYQLTISEVSCHGFDDGSILLEMDSTFGFTPYTFSLDNGIPTNANYFDSLIPGNHSIVVTNTLGCDTTILFEIIEPTPLQIALPEIENVTCFGFDDGWIKSFASGGTLPYTFGWSNDMNLNDSINGSLAPGTYTAHIWDQNGCTISMDTVITEPSALVHSFGFNNILCFGETTLVTSNPSGGTFPYDYLWSTQSTATSENLIAGSHTILITDDNGCELLDTVVLIEPEALEMIISLDTVVCLNSTIPLSTSITGGTTPYSYNWTGNSNNSSTINYTASTDQWIVCDVIDDNGCSISDSVFVEIYVSNIGDFVLTSNRPEVCIDDSSSINYLFNPTVPMLDVFWNDCPSCTFPRTVYPVSDTSFTASLVTICYDTLMTTIPIELIEVPDMNFDLSTGEFCPFTDIQFGASGIPPNSWTYYWEFDNGINSTDLNPVVQYTSPGTYVVNLVITNSIGCIYSTDRQDTLVITPLPIASFLTDFETKTLLDPTFNFTNLSELATSYLWNFGDDLTSTVIHPTHTYAYYDDFRVELIAYNHIGCSDTIDQIIQVTPDHIIHVPNTFTPDGDQFNEVFLIRGVGIDADEYELLIFNRWGEVIFESRDINHGWDGRHNNKQVQDGVYVWKINYKDKTGKKHFQVGHVTVLK